MGTFDKENWLYIALHGRSIVNSHDVADKKTAMTHGADLTRTLANMIGKKEALSRAFNIASEKSYTWLEILGFYLEVLEQKIGKRPKVYIREKSIKMKDGSKYQVMSPAALTTPLMRQPSGSSLPQTRSLTQRRDCRQLCAIS